MTLDRSVHNILPVSARSHAIAGALRTAEQATVIIIFSHAYVQLGESVLDTDSKHLYYLHMHACHS